MEKLVDDLGVSYDLQMRINAVEALGRVKDFEGVDVITSLLEAGKSALFEWSDRKLILAFTQNVNPDRIILAPHADPSRVTLAVITALSELTNHQDESISQKARNALKDLQNSAQKAYLFNPF